MIEIKIPPYFTKVTKNGKIAALKRHQGNRTYNCATCQKEIPRETYYWLVVYAGAGLGNMKFPDRTHVGDCFKKIMED